MDTMDFYKFDMYFNIDMSILYKNTTHNCWYKMILPQMLIVARANFCIYIFMTH